MTGWSVRFFPNYTRSHFVHALYCDRDDFNVKKAQWMDNEHKWFMEILEALTPEESSQLCEYITGSPQVRVTVQSLWRTSKQELFIT